MPFDLPPEPPSPWREFLAAVDHELPAAVELTCLGGFIVSVRYGRPRPTGDLDYVEIIPADQRPIVDAIAGRQSSLFEKYGLYFEHVAVAELPEAYAERCTELWPGRFEKLRLFQVDPHDLALSKLARNTPADREDVAYLARVVPLDPEILRSRFHEELRSIILGDPDMHGREVDRFIKTYLSGDHTA